MSYKLLAKIFSPNTFRTANFLCAGGGAVISGSSAVKFYKTNNGIARTCYAISGLSTLAAAGNALGGPFLWIGNEAQKIGNYVEQKKNGGISVQKILLVVQPEPVWVIKEWVLSVHHIWTFHLKIF